MPKRIEMIGKKFGRLIVLEMFGEQVSARHPKWKCICDCGNQTIKTATALRNGREPSCGCAAKDFQRQKNSIVGKKFGRLTVIEPLPTSNKQRHILWKCICDCGNEHVSISSDLKTGHTKSCGCLHIQMMTENIKHGHSRAGIVSPTYVSWASMITRCKNKKSLNYKYYGGSGVKVCERWLNFENFLSDMGERPNNLSLDRINPYGNYEPSNCRWADFKTQQLNKRKNNENRMVEEN